MKRKPVTPAMRVKCLLSRHFTPCSGCGQRLNPEDRIEWDHIHALVHGGDHHYTNLRPLHYECHKPKTKADIQANAKIKRIRGERKPKVKRSWPTRKLLGRGFEKRVK